MKHTIEEYEKAIRYHRQHTYDTNGDCHERAIARLKKTKIMQELYKKNKKNSAKRRSDMMLNTYA
jgi:hypothetical protein